MLRPIVLLVLTSALAAAQEPAPVSKCALAGTVVDGVTGQSLNKVTVSAENVGANGAQVEAAADAKGNFRLAGLTPGIYRLWANRNGYLRTAYGAKRAGGSGASITVTAGQELADLRIPLYAYGVIAGTVRDTDGEPLVGVGIVAMRQKYDKGKRSVEMEGFSARTDDLGQYRIPSLPPGRYYVLAQAESESGMTVNGPVRSMKKQRLLSAYYPGVTDPDLARLVEVSAGARVTGTDITLTRSKVVRVTVKVTGPAKSELAVSLVSGHVGAGALSRQVEGDKQDDGTFGFQDVAPGPYTLLAEAQPPSDTPQTEVGFIVFNMTRSSGARASMPLVVGDSDIEGLTLTVMPGAEVKGHVTVEDPDGNPQKRPTLPAEGRGFETLETVGSIDFDQGGEGDPGAIVKPDGSFVATLSPGLYSVYLDDPTLAMRGQVVKAILSEHTDVLHNGLTISGPGTVPLEIVLAPIGGAIDGTALDKDEKPVAGAVVALIPALELRARHDRYFDATADQYGHFELQNVPPGDYKILAWDDVEPDIWYDPAFLLTVESKADSIALKPKARETLRVHIRQ